MNAIYDEQKQIHERCHICISDFMNNLGNKVMHSKSALISLVWLCFALLIELGLSQINSKVVVALTISIGKAKQS